MRILLFLPVLFAVAGPALAQQTAEPEERATGDDTQFRLIAGAEHTRGEVGDGLDYETTSTEAHDLGQRGPDPVYGRGLVCRGCGARD